MNALRSAVLFACACAVLAIACGDGDAEPTPASATPGAAGTPHPLGTPLVTPSTGGTAGGPAPILPGPVERYTPSEEDLQGYYKADSANALPTNEDLYAQVGPFPNSTDGLELAKAWKYVGGYLVGFDPEGLLSSVVRGNYYVTTEAHLFETPDDARKAYQQYLKFYRSNPIIEEQTAAPLGNESSAWRALGGKLGDTQIDEVYHRFLLRRGNLIIQVETLGGLPFMTPDAARDVAIIMDERALGQRAAPVPTPARVPGQPSVTP